MLQINAVPGNAAFLVAHKVSEAQGALAAEPAQHGKERLGVDLGIADIPVRMPQVSCKIEVEAAG